MVTRFQIGELDVEVIQKDIKNIHLSVLPPTGTVRIAVPLRTSLNAVRVFAISKLAWIRQQQKKLQEQERETPREYLDRESHYLWGRRYLLKLVETDSTPQVLVKHNRIVLQIRQKATEERKRAILEAWYREQLRTAALPLIAKWEPIIGGKVSRLYVRKMKTKWGSCNPPTGSVRLNTDLAKKPRECLEYIVVHEIVHFLEPTHNARFVSLMNSFMPRWQFYRDTLNRLPVRHESWLY